MKNLWLFPGQGNQKAGMLASVDPNLKEKVEKWTGIKLLDTQAGYQDSQQIQLSILLLQIDQIDRLNAEGWIPDLVAGHSLGIFAAAYAANVINKEDVFKLVSLRAKLMQESYPKGYGMGVVVGMDRNTLKKLINQVFSKEDLVFLSNENSELQNTLSGQLTAIEKVLKMAKENGATNAKLLKVPNPSHSPLMQSVADKMTKSISKIKLNQPNCIYLANYNGCSFRNLEGIRYDLSNNLIYPVYWDTMMNVALEYQPNVSLEFSPGTVFTKLLKIKNTHLSTISLQNMSVDDAGFLLNKWRKN